MKIKKNPKSNLENYSKLFMQLGLVVALFVTYVMLEKKTYEEQKIEELAKNDMGDVLDEETLMLNTPPPPPPPPPTEAPPPPPAPPKLKIEDDEKDVEESKFLATEEDQDEKQKIIDAKDIKTADEEPEEEPEEDVPFSVIEEVPIFPGCTGSRAEKKKCLEIKMRKHAAKHFNAELGEELGLKSGKHRIMVQFKIDKTGKVTDIITKAAHPSLEKEARRIVKKLPKLKPGKQRGKPVGVKYTLPIGFRVE